MKVRHLIFLLMVTAFSTPRVVEAQSGDWVNEGTLVRQGDVSLDPTTMRPYTGRVFKFDNADPSKVWWTYSMKDGLRHGPYEIYYKNGQLMWREVYSNGKLHGLYESYYEYGRLRGKGNYSNGEKCGEWIEEGEAVTYDPCPSN